jgi:hypothetical protein
MNKKGSGTIFDVIYIMIILFMFIVITIIAVKVYNEWNIGSSSKIENPTSDIALMKVDTALSSLDYAFAFLVGMLFILVFISAFTIETHPVFFIVSLFLLIFALILAVAFSNIYETISTVKLTEEASRYSISNYLMGNLPFIILVAIISVSVILYAKFKWS